MGIRYLNKFLRINCVKSINCIHLSELSGKKIAVDISIYMYKFAGDGNLIENMYVMLSIFRKYNIIPIFIFDGKSPTEKKELLIKRKNNKIESESEYNNLQLQLQKNKNMDKDEKQEIISNMDLLKKKFIYITKEQIQSVKELIRAYGLTYFDAPGEADELCAHLVINKKVWACLSEDMYMFVYGCSNVLRYFSLINHTAVLYDVNNCLSELNINQCEFRQICVLSGTDYNINNNSENTINLYNIMLLFKTYKTSINIADNVNNVNNVNNTNTFYDWIILHHKNYINNLETLQNIYQLFDLSKKHDSLNIFNNIQIMNGPILREVMRPILEEDGFIFAN